MASIPRSAVAISPVKCLVSAGLSTMFVQLTPSVERLL